MLHLRNTFLYYNIFVPEIQPFAGISRILIFFWGGGGIRGKPILQNILNNTINWQFDPDQNQDFTI